MRWRFTDRIISYEAWRSIAGSKAVSFEELSALKHLGREGQLPESLVLECCVQLGRWLVAASSEFTLTCVLADLEDFAFHRPPGPGAVLQIDLGVEQKEDRSVVAHCVVSTADGAIADGRITLSLEEEGDPTSAAEAEAVWGEISAAS